MSDWRELDQSDRDLVRALVSTLRRRHDLEFEVEGLRMELASQPAPSQERVNRTASRWSADEPETEGLA